MRTIDADAIPKEFLEYEFDGKWNGCTIKDLIDEQPTIQPEPKWIPVSERLPEDLEEVSVTYVNRNPPSYYDFIKDEPATAFAVYYKGKWFWYSSTCADYLSEYGFRAMNAVDVVDDVIEIIAWMPKPEAYKQNNK